jgi:hypothetical protein
LLKEARAAVDDCVAHGLDVEPIKRQLQSLELEGQALGLDQPKISEAIDAPGGGAPAQLPETTTSNERATQQTTRRRGRRPRKLEQVKEAMRSDLREGSRTETGLRNMLEKELEAAYGVSRNTARKARNAVLLESGGNSKRDKYRQKTIKDN